MRILRAVLLIPVLLAFFAGAAFAKAPASTGGGLDRTFADGGKLLLSPNVTGPGAAELLGNDNSQIPRRGEAMPTQILPLGKGRFLLAGGTRLFRFEADGKLDQGFGEGGRLEIPAPAGQTLVPRGVSIDPQGRILVAAEAEDIGAAREPTPGKSEYFAGLSGPPPVRAAILRLLPNGHLDQSFGSGGVFESTFGAAAPTYEGGEYATPVAQGLSVSSDSQGHPILSGDIVTKAVDCYPFTESSFETQAFLARFGADGSLESVSTDPGGSGSQALFLGPDGKHGLASIGWQGDHCMRSPEPVPSTFAFLTPGGEVTPGSRPTTVSLFGVPAFALDASGGVVLTKGNPAPGGETDAFVTRLFPNGAPDKSFGGGEVRLPSGFGYGAMAVDRSDRTVLTGTLEIGSDPIARTFGFELLRLTPHGAIDRGFGKDGKASVPFSAAEEATAPAVMVDGSGRIVVAGRVRLRNSGREALALARFLPGN